VHTSNTISFCPCQKETVLDSKEKAAFWVRQNPGMIVPPNHGGAIDDSPAVLSPLPLMRRWFAGLYPAGGGFRPL